ncbi:MAG: bifunctional precorrin-2 dehydrogenase/sirohydrochlorin ferrochelatase [Euryarchaeota archaeon]|nr:bifunctional precorrin-2 dehydrogenase/sirohydrochlorin ferrochelatase [Euryarchaeota archaeon]
MLPLFIDMVGKRVAVFGAGPVGTRKANYFIEEAEVVAISLDFTDELDPRVRRIRGDAQELMSEWIEWADIIIAATDSEVLNKLISGEASKRGKLFNSTDGTSSFFIPSLVSKDKYSIAISTNGRSPAMSRFLRLKLEEDLDERYDLMIRLQEEIREMARGAISSQQEREQYLRSILNDKDIWKALLIDYSKAKEIAVSKMVN